MFIPLIHIQIDWASLVTHHRIKVALTLLSPIIFGAITAYIAWQQHCLAKTQANISRDQRDIAYGKQNLENFDKLYEYVDDFYSLYINSLYLPSYYPRNHVTNNTHKIFDIYKVYTDIEKNDFSDYEKKWYQYYTDKCNSLDEILYKCKNHVEKLNYMFDENIMKKIKNFIRDSESLILHKKYMIFEYLDSELNSEQRLKDSKYEKLEKESLIKSYHEMKEEIKPYISVSDILAPRKLGE